MLSGERQQQLIQMNTLVEAYGEFCDFDTTQLTLIEPLRIMRMVHSMAWLATRPSLPTSFSLVHRCQTLGTTNTWTERTILGTSSTYINTHNSTYN
jgi:Ser/Thr protein kinase RdoA (MazF antagonist)